MDLLFNFQVVLMLYSLISSLQFCVQSRELALLAISVLAVIFLDNLCYQKALVETNNYTIFTFIFSTLNSFVTERLIEF